MYIEITSIKFSTLSQAISWRQYRFQPNAGWPSNQARRHSTLLWLTSWSTFQKWYKDTSNTSINKIVCYAMDAKNVPQVQSRVDNGFTETKMPQVLIPAYWPTKNVFPGRIVNISLKWQTCASCKNVEGQWTLWSDGWDNKLWQCCFQGGLADILIPPLLTHYQLKR